MKKIVFFLLVVFGSFGCYTQKKAVKDLNKIRTHYPDLIETKTTTKILYKTDTIEIEIPESSIAKDWTWDWVENPTGDSVLVANDRGETKVVIQRDTIFKNGAEIKIRTRFFRDTIRVIDRDTVTMTNNVTEVVTKVENRIPWWMIAAFLLSLAGIVYLGFFHRDKK